MYYIIAAVGILFGTTIGYILSRINEKVLGSLIINNSDDGVQYYVTLENGTLNRIPKNGDYVKLIVKETNFDARPE